MKHLIGMLFLILVCLNNNAMEISSPLPLRLQKDESDEAFKHRLFFIAQNLSESKLSNVNKMGRNTLLIDRDGNLLIEELKKVLCVPYASNTYLFKKGPGDKDDLSVCERAVYTTVSGKFVAALTKKYSYPITNIGFKNLLFFDVELDTRQSIDPSELPDEYVYITRDAVKRYVQNGYEFRVSAKDWEVFVNPINSIAISSSGKVVAVANNNNVFTTEQDKKGIFSPLEFMKAYPAYPEIDEKNYQEFKQSEKIVHISFNEQETKLGVIRQTKDPNTYNIGVIDLK